MKKVLSVGDAGEDVATVHKLLESHGVSVPAEEVARNFFGPGTREAVGEFQRNKGIQETREISAETANLLSSQPVTTSAIAGTASASVETTSASKSIVDLAATTVDLTHVGILAPQPSPGPGPTANGADHLVTGRVLLDQGLPADGVTLRFYHKDFGGEVRIDETKTDAAGSYSLPYSAGGKTINLEVRAVDAQGTEISLSDTKFNAGNQETLNLVAPSSVKSLAAEYPRLRTDIEKQIVSLDKLGAAQEAGERQDLSLLYNSTGWDARLIALAANANKLSSDTGIPQEALYGLFRAGLPTEKEQLAQVSETTFEQVLTKAKDAGIVSLNDQQVAEAKTSLANFARTTRLAAKAPGAVSTFGDLLNVAGSGAATKLNDNEKQVFADLYFSHRGTTGELWQKARERGVPDTKIQALRFQGKLAYLTLNNANLVATLQTEIGSTENLAQLVDRDLYKEDAWKASLSANDIPAAYSGGVDAYTSELARKVRVSFPTQVVARMVEKDELVLGENHQALKSPVTTFLRNAVSQGYELGRMPLRAFIQQNPETAFTGIAATDVQTTTETVEQLHRLYQITPSNEALSTAMSLGFKSAHDVTQFTRETFLERFGAKFRSQDEANLFYRKSEQITTVVYNFVTAAKQLESAAPIYAVSAPASDRENAKNELIKHYPTMESLFGSLDFCECEHCRSVLSPAAYLVDLMQFLDPKALVWESTMADWKIKHNGAPYPFSNPLAWNDFLTTWRAAHPGQPDPDTQKNPYDVLIERRPDLPHLSLTCENTNTALPYIDVVNEILEYYVAKDRLDEQAVNNTGAATTPELLAEPQNVTPAAYDTLKGVRYPLNLPFDLWLETVREFFQQSDTSFWKVLELFRPSDELFAPPADPKAYYRVSMFAEYLGISPAEREMFTAKNSLARWFELYGYASEADALASLKSAKTLSRRLGITYKNLVELVQTAFVNPRLDALVILRKLEMEPTDLFRYEGHPGYPALSEDEKQAFEKRLTEFGASMNLTLADVKAKLDASFQAAKPDELLLLADPDTGCNFDLTRLRYANSTDADALAFLKINLFVRLWKKLGWTIEETDRALDVFLPQDSLPLTAANLGDGLASALIYIAHLKALKNRVNVGKDSVLKLLTLWSNLPTTGRNPLYAQLFLNRTILKNDAVFDDPLGAYLSKPGLWVKDHSLALQSSLKLTADEIGRILEDRGQKIDTAQLSLANVSLLFRSGLTARALKLSVRDLITIKALSGLDPFTELNSAPLAKLEDDHPFNQTIRFFEIAEKIKDSGFKVEDIDYLLRHRLDPVGKYRVNTQNILDVVRSLATGIQRIRSEHAVPDDAASFTDDVLRQKLSLALPAEIAETFLAMWTATREYEGIFPTPVLPANKLKSETFVDEPAIRVSYDDTRQQQRLTMRGVLTDTRKADLKAKFPSGMVATLLDDVQNQAKTFFQKYLLKTVGEEPFAGFLDNADFEFLFGSEPGGLSDADKQKRIREKRAKLAKAFLPFLQQRLIRQLILQTLTTSLGAEPALVETLVTRGDMLGDPSYPGKPLLDGFIAAGEHGVSVSYFASTDATGAAIQPTSTSATAATNGKPPATNSIKFQGYVEVPTNGPYRFFVELGKKDAAAQLRFDHLADPLLRGSASTDGAELSQFTELKAGLSYRFTLDISNLGGGEASLFVSGQDLPRGSLTRLLLYPLDVVDRANRAWILLSKSLQLIQGFAFNENETRYLLKHGADFADLDLSKLPTFDSDNSAIAATLFGGFIRLADLARLKRELADNTDDLFAIFENARRTYPSTADPNQAKSTLLDDVCNRTANLTRRDAAAVKEATQSLGLTVEQLIVGNELRIKAAGFADERGISRLWEVLQVSERLGVSSAAIARWATPAPDFAIARELKDTVKARYEVENWQRIAQPIFDKLRQKQRDALVAYTIQRHGFERLEQLLEYFLIDPGMEPVVQTSRLRLAISSVQLFIQRCLLNLEPQVSPSVINAKHWLWMKRYRVWEANRKIFLFPENWLEPEFRDDKTFLFQELESAILEGDVSNDLVEGAFFQYLKKLEEIARLDIVAMYCDRKPEPDLNVFYVVGRTHDLPHKYYFRRYANQMWTPWEPISMEIEGDHIVAVIWRERLHLFWLTFMEKAKKNSQAATSIPDESIGHVAQAIANVAPVKEVEVQLNWTEQFQGDWTTRKSSGFVNMNPGSEFSSFDSGQVFVSAYKEYDESGEERAVRINLGGAIQAAFRVVSKNSQPERVNSTYSLGFPYTGIPRKTQYTASGVLEVNFIEQITTENDKVAEPKQTIQKIFNRGSGYSLLVCNELFGIDTDALARTYPNEDVLDNQRRLTNVGKYLLNEFLPIAMSSPFFYQDSQNTFFVEPTLTETTIDRWEEWVIPNPGVTHHWDDTLILDNIPLEPHIPLDPRIIASLPPIAIDPRAHFSIERKVDWATHPATVLTFEGHLIGQAGGLAISAHEVGGIREVAVTSSVLAGSGKASTIAAGSTRSDETALSAPALTVVSTAGLNAATLEAITSSPVTSKVATGLVGTIRGF